MKYLSILLVFMASCGCYVETGDKDGGSDTGAESSKDSALSVCEVLPATMFCNVDCPNQCFNQMELTCIEGNWKPTGKKCP